MEIDDKTMQALLPQSKALTPEEWKALAYRLVNLGELLAELLRKSNKDGNGERDAELLMADISCAFGAIRWVSEFASEKCRFVSVEQDAKKGKITVDREVTRACVALLAGERGPPPSSRYGSR